MLGSVHFAGCHDRPEDDHCAARYKSIRDVGPCSELGQYIASSNLPRLQLDGDYPFLIAAIDAAYEQEVAPCFIWIRGRFWVIHVNGEGPARDALQ